MTLSYTGTLTAPLDGLRNLLAASTSFQSWVDADDAAEAKESIKLFEIPNADVVHPYALIFPDSWKDKSIAVYGGAFDFSITGQICLMFEDVVPQAYTNYTEEAFIWWLNNIEAVKADLWSLGGTASNYIVINEIESFYGPARSELPERHQGGDIIQQLLRISWGFGE